MPKHRYNVAIKM